MVISLSVILRCCLFSRADGTVAAVQEQRPVGAGEESVPFPILFGRELQAVEQLGIQLSLPGSPPVF